MKPRHECGVCDEDSLEYRYMDAEGHRWFTCLNCGEWHTSQDCCDNPFVKVGDRIRLVSMPNDPDPVPVGSIGTVERIVCDDQSQPQHMDQIQMSWDNGRTLNLAPEVDRYEIDTTYLITEEVT